MAITTAAVHLAAVHLQVGTVQCEGRTEPLHQPFDPHRWFHGFVLPGLDEEAQRRLVTSAIDVVPRARTTTDLVAANLEVAGDFVEPAS